MTRDNKPVYSTASGDLRKTKTDGSSRNSNPIQPNSGKSSSSGPAKMRLETAGRGGKAVTVLFNLPVDEPAARQMMKEMQSSFGCGATFKDSVIELRGDVRDRVEAYFAKKNLKIIRAGGR